MFLAVILVAGLAYNWKSRDVTPATHVNAASAGDSRTDKSKAESNDVKRGDSAVRSQATHAEPPADEDASQPGVPGAPKRQGDYALRVTGRESRIDIPDAMIATRNPWTLEGWVTPRQPLPTLGGSALVFAVNPLWLAVRDSGRGQHKWLVGGPVFKAPTTLFAESALVAGKRAHVAVTRGPAGVSFFFNGISQGPPLTIAFSSPQSRLQLRPLGTAKGDVPFNGDVDEVRLSSIERYRANFWPQLRLEADKNTLALYHFDEGDGDVLQDSSGHNHHGKITGATWVPAVSE
jgi:hypothetical protein